MTTTKSANSRPSSARAGSVARTITKRRDKPYKTEQSRILAKKRKLNLHTTYTIAPEGFQFLPVGNPDLADRCKELSRQKGFPVNVVNAKPVSKQAEDPEKVSHHIHRIGYHFRSEIVDTACQELGYTYSHGNFIKEEDLREQNDQSKLARAMAKHGLQITAPLKRETDDQVRAAIKELFPRIPEEDLKEILKHAWKEGSSRVGTISTLTLPRRVQLAVIARIRHTYTDYDRLLRAFEWKDARALVEPVCLAKLIEWRGEDDEEDDDELEEIVRETIVIDDDEDNAPRNGSEADDEDSLIEDGGYISDTSVEISHRPAGDADLGAESHDERSRRFLDRYQPPLHTTQRRNLDVRQKIGLVREQLRNGVALEHAQQSEVFQVHVPESGEGLVNINGKLYRREPTIAQTPRPQQRIPAQQPMPQRGAYSYQHGQSPQSSTLQPYTRPSSSSDGCSLHDRPVASIEPHDDLRRMAISSATMQQKDPYSNAARSRPASPDSERLDKRRRLEHPSPRTGPPASSHHPLRTPAAIHPLNQPNYPSTVIDLTLTDSPPRRYSGRSSLDGRGIAQSDHQVSMHAFNGRPQTFDVSSGRIYGQSHDPRPVDAPYVSHHPLIPASHRGDQPRQDTRHPEQKHRSGFVDAQIAPIQYVPLAQRSLHSLHSRPTVAYQGQSSAGGYATSQQPQVIYVQSQRPSQTPQPVHGAPAAVQQISREAMYATPALAIPAANGNAPATSTAQHPPAMGYTSQPQYYYPR